VYSSNEFDQDWQLTTHINSPAVKLGNRNDKGGARPSILADS